MRGVGGCHPPDVDVFTNWEALQTPCYWDIYGGFITSARVIINSIASPSPFSREVGGAEGWKFQASDHGLVFLLTCPHPGALTQSLLLRAKDTPTALTT